MQKHPQFITAEDMDNVIMGDQRSAELQASDKKEINALLKKAKTKVATAKMLGLDRNTFANMLKNGTCNPKTLENVRLKIERIKAA